MKKVSNLVLMITLILTACGDAAAETAATDALAEASNAAAGAQLFAQATLGGQAGCSTCHSLSPDTVIVGPPMTGIGQVAADRVAGLTAEAYLRQAIFDPNAFIVDGFTPNVMPSQYADNLTPDEIDRLVDYLLTLQ